MSGSKGLMGESKPRKGKALGDKGDDAVSSVTSTAFQFANRLQRKLKEQECQEEASQKAQEERHAAMLQALTIIRRALDDTSKINLGKRFCLRFEVSDWEGWPRLTLNLVDSAAPDRKDYGLIVSASDRHDRGLILLREQSGALLGKIELREEGEYERIPLILKKTVRSFLDEVASYVLNPIKESELIEQMAAPVEAEILDEDAEKLKEVDVFNDDDELDNLRDNLVDEDKEARPLETISFEKE